MSLKYEVKAQAVSQVSTVDTGSMRHITTPTNPASGFSKLYFKSDNNLYKLNSAGVEVEVGGGGGGVTYPLLAPAGTGAAPSYAFAAEPGTGFSQVGGAGTLSVSVANSVRFNFSTSAFYPSSTDTTDLGTISVRFSVVHSNRFSAGDGSAANAAYRFAGAPGTGLSSNGTVNMHFGINGTFQMLLTSSALSPFSSGGIALGTNALPWSNVISNNSSCTQSSWSTTIGGSARAQFDATTARVLASGDTSQFTMWSPNNANVNFGIQAGDPATGVTGSIFLSTGNASINNNSGSIKLYTGTVSGSGTRGQIILATVQVNPVSNGTVQFGNSSLLYTEVWTAQIRNLQGSIRTSVSTPSAVSTAYSIRTDAASGNLGVFTGDNSTNDASATGGVYIESGNKTAGTGASGDIVIRTGTSVGGARGVITLNAITYNITGTNQNQKIIPTTNNAVKIGDSTNQFYSSNILFTQSQNSLDANHVVMMSGNLFGLIPGGGQGLGGYGFGTTYPLTIITQSHSTANADQTLDIRLITGNKTAGTGNSGSIIIQSGTSAGGVRGDATINVFRIDASASTGPWRVPNLAADPASPLNGDIWYNTTVNQLKAYSNGGITILA